MPEKEDPTVLVTGATGYIALHIVRLLLKEGYRVRGTVRDLKNEAKLQTLKNMCPDSRYPLELVEANLTEEKGWFDAVKGCTYVLHVASPFPNSRPKNEDDVIRPAVDGTKRVLRACAEVGTVKRVVLTSSVAAVHGESITDDNMTYTEEDWSDVTSKHMEAYSKSKTIAEKAAWNFVKTLPEHRRFELSVLNPGLVLGPVLNGEVSTSVELIQRMMDFRTMPMVPKLNFCVCDVRDLALCHLKAMILPEAAGHRHLIVSEHLWLWNISQMIHREFVPQGYAIPIFSAPFYLLWLYSFIDKSTSLLLSRYGKEYRFDNSRMRNVLGVYCRDSRQTVLDTAYSLIENGVVGKAKNYLPPTQDAGQWGI